MRASSVIMQVYVLSRGEWQVNAVTCGFLNAMIKLIIAEYAPSAAVTREPRKKMRCQVFIKKCLKYPRRILLMPPSCLVTIPVKGLKPSPSRTAPSLIL